MSEVVDLYGLTAGARRRWWLILLFVLLGAAAGYGWSSMMQPTYQATTSVMVGESLQASDLTKQDLEASQQLAQTYADLVRRQPVLSGASAALGLDTSWESLRDRVNVDLAPDGGALIVITSNAASAGQAEDLAAAIADELVGLSPSETTQASVAEIQQFVDSRLATLEGDIGTAQERIDALERDRALATTERRQEELRLEIEEQQRLVIAWLENYSSLLGFRAPEQAPNSLQILEEASAQVEPVRPDTVANTALAGAVGLLLALAVVYVLEARRRRQPDGFDPAVGWRRARRRRRGASGVADPDVPIILPDAASDPIRLRLEDAPLAAEFVYGPEGRHRRRRVG